MILVNSRWLNIRCKSDRWRLWSFVNIDDPVHSSELSNNKYPGTVRQKGFLVHFCKQFSLKCQNKTIFKAYRYTYRGNKSYFKNYFPFHLGLLLKEGIWSWREQIPSSTSRFHLVRYLSYWKANRNHKKSVFLSSTWICTGELKMTLKYEVNPYILSRALPSSLYMQTVKTGESVLLLTWALSLHLC